MILRIKLDHGAYIPEKAHTSDAGWDIRTPVDVFIPKKGSAVVDTGVHFGIPTGMCGLLKSKSGLNVICSLINEGVIDSGYTGSVRVKMYNLGNVDREIKAGEKLTQILFVPVPPLEEEIVNDLGETERGNNGFGSSGR